MALWPNSAFARPVSSFVQPVPVPGVDPLSGDCVILRINKAWLPYVAGALQQLVLQTTWDVTGAALQEVQGQAMNLILAINDAEPGDCSKPIPTPGVQELDYEMSVCEQLKFMNGILYGFCCGEWTPIEGQGTDGVVNPGQPGAPITPPAPSGGSGDYCYVLGGSDVRILPFNVNSGDTLQFHDLRGAWRDGREVIWNCPDGWIYALGACGQAFPHGSPDPLPTALHMQLLVKIGSNYYDGLALDGDGNPTLWTVPGGISNQQVEILPNIDDDTQVEGQISFCVTLTNNQAPTGPWQATLDFTAQPWASAVNAIDGLWFGGEGYIGVPVGDSPSYVQLYLPTGAFEMDSIVMTYSQGALGSDPGFQIQADGSALNSGTQGVGEHLTVSAGAHSVTTNLQVILTTGAGGSACQIEKLVINGHGTKPANLP